MKITNQKLIQYAKHPAKFALWLGRRGWLPFISDEAYIKLQFKETFGYPLDLAHPRTFNEKIQWIKLYDRRPEYTLLADKCAAKKWVADRIGEEYIIPTLGVWEHFDNIDFNHLPNQFVLKCTHDSGSAVIVRDKAKLDKAAAKKKLEHALRRNYYVVAREWQYKDIPPRIIAEEYLFDKKNPDQSVNNYKCFCMNGVCDYFYIAIGGGHSESHTVTYFDREMHRLPLRHCAYEPEKGDVKIPPEITTIFGLAETLAQGIPQVRVDFYCVNSQVYVGELTLTSDAGLNIFDPPEYDEILGKKIILPNKTEYTL